MTSLLSGAKLLLGEHVGLSVAAALGPVVTRTDIQSSVGPFLMLPEYRTQYPEVVIRALGELYAEYNAAFQPLVEANREWDTDYQYCLHGENKSSVNYAVQVDMVGLPDSFLQAVAGLSVADVREALRGQIFEIENSLAMYQFMERIFSKGQQASVFQGRFRAFLDELRARFGMPVALLAVTDQKYEAMRAEEFGKENGEPLSDAEVMCLSGFDRLFGPSDFRRHVEENGGACRYLLYARTSDPVAKLKQPALVVEQPLLGDPLMRRVIKAHALTFNVDAPELGYERRINDTKEYAVLMNMAFPARSMTDILSSGLDEHLSQRKAYVDYSGVRLSRDFAAYLEAQGVDSARVESGEALLRCKPMKGAYGCYGHVRGALGDKEFRCELRSNIRKRGPYIVQPEMRVFITINETDGQTYTCIDRNFFALTNGQLQFLGGLRSLMPVDSVETRKGRNHGNSSTVWAEVV